MSSNQLPNSNYSNSSISLDARTGVNAGSASDGAGLYSVGLSAGPDVGYSRNASLRSSGGAYGSERSVCWAKSGKGQSTTTVTSSSSVNNTIIANVKAAASAAAFDIELTAAAPSSLLGLKGAVAVASANTSQQYAGSIGQSTTTNNTTVIDINNNKNYPPSPPAEVAAAKPLTMANVSALQDAAVVAAGGVAGGSPFSAISTSPTTDNDAEESSDEEGDSTSEISFSSTSSLSSSDAGNAVSNGNNNNVSAGAPATQDHRFLASVFGSSYLDEFTKLGVEVIAPAADVFPDEPVLDGAVVLAAPVNKGASRTLYLSPKEMEKLDSQTLVELLEVADEDLECSGVVICLERKANDEPAKETLAETLHALMYVGGTIVPPDAGVVKYDSERYILVGLEL